MELPFSWVKCTVTSKAFPDNREGKGGRERKGETKRQRHRDTETEKPRYREA